MNVEEAQGWRARPLLLTSAPSGSMQARLVTTQSTADGQASGRSRAASLPIVSRAPVGPDIAVTKRHSIPPPPSPDECSARSRYQESFSLHRAWRHERMNGNNSLPRRHAPQGSRGKAGGAGRRSRRPGRGQLGGRRLLEH